MTHNQCGIEAGGKFAAVQMDVSNREDVMSLWTKVPSELHQVDILGLYLVNGLFMSF